MSKDIYSSGRYVVRVYHDAWVDKRVTKGYGVLNTETEVVEYYDTCLVRCVSMAKVLDESLTKVLGGNDSGSKVLDTIKSKLN